ncbi:hypothetical protein MSMEI_5598 [Mycolicibacterium smegmatis MC2 155]|uniref:Uncharacterized protein n=1 Tax=Mycolicibacterium smegmatis (strain ATCC 700084 / mc(2)155) TaxID=246196 RepID=I7FT36_MYCS2|nr:hypothetical protein MSMEI_5598 [Mycolicibacterium smegmatis MC2 155]
MRSRGVVDVSTRSAEGVESVLDPLAEDLGPGPRDHSRGRTFGSLPENSQACKKQ